MKEFIKNHIPRELEEEEKSEAQKQTEKRAKKYTDFFKDPLDKLKHDNRPKLAAAYKIIAGFFVDSAKLEPTTYKGSFRERLNNKKNFKEKVLFFISTGAKVIGKTALGSVQFIVRNSIKQPAMLVFRIGAGINNLIKYKKAKIKGDNTRATNELNNIKYQAKETFNAIIGTAFTAAIIVSTLGSAGIAIPCFGVAATAAVTTTAEAIDSAGMAKDAIQNSHNQIKKREGEPLIKKAHKKELEFSNISKARDTLSGTASKIRDTLNTYDQPSSSHHHTKVRTNTHHHTKVRTNTHHHTKVRTNTHHHRV